MRSEVVRRFQMLLVLCSISLGTGFPTKSRNFAHKIYGQPVHNGGVQPDAEASEQQNQVQSLLPEPHSQQRRWSHPQQRSVGVLPQPEPEEETKPFIFDFNNFPDLANADMNSQNPNIQVTIEVVDDPQMEVEMDLANEKDWLPPSSPSSTVDRLGEKKIFWPLFWSYTDTDSSEGSNSRSAMEETTEEEEEEDYSLDYGSEEPLPSGVGRDWDTHWNEGWDPIQRYYDKDTDEWTPWSPCSVTCGHGDKKRTKSCGYSCTLTESSKCDLEPCPGDDNTVVEPFPFEMENGTEPFGTDVDSCEKWLNCKSEFLQRYLHQVLSELPSCPCSYPSEAAYTVVSLHDDTHSRSFRWRDASGPKERLDIYKPSARSCIRSALSGDSSTLAAQHCCYDNFGRLITRGKGAGTPNLISTEFSPELHFKVDVLPWILCKGDWSRFHAVRPPNNGLSCPENPHEDVFMNELEEAREY
ncbi:isthmin-2 [Nematolebias whitei]|uniref:isthmin-2 n=1 Tax=Nematolebias whitei TaxID=451745 RepID=UPI0018977680|nr:isthmin-2 [Nematolebias whitei]